ncbi:hypothetical protein PVAP13_6KG233724 [Panicum virgatum]|uniref:Uncharacterized protein n=1 Tax=Panicum virgatum TaxID=38727 RepID=A0A8T0RER3_PANVG|nr:hypothetical protein PVAP13_6KG233724 [Panicum virgatum]
MGARKTRVSDNIRGGGGTWAARPRLPKIDGPSNVRRAVCGHWDFRRSTEAASPTPPTQLPMCPQRVMPCRPAAMLPPLRPSSCHSAAMLPPLHPSLRRPLADCFRIKATRR